MKKISRFSQIDRRPMSKETALLTIKVMQNSCTKEIWVKGIRRCLVCSMQIKGRNLLIRCIKICSNGSKIDLTGRKNRGYVLPY